MLKFTIIIPHRVGENIEKTLEGVYLSNYPKEDIEIFQAEGTHPTVQRNECIKQSLGDIVYFIDNDSIVSADNIKEASIIFESNENVAVVGGPAIHNVNSLTEMYIDRCM
ncbi:glycosyltransferase, partial [Brachyspira hampsonii]